MNKEEQWGSPWRENVTLPCFDSAPEEVRTDVLIIGGGIAGLLTAYFLKEAGVDCLLIEAETICSGVTGNTTAKITVGHGLVYDKLRRRFSLDAPQDGIFPQTGKPFWNISGLQGAFPVTLRKRKM